MLVFSPLLLHPLSMVLADLADGMDSSQCVVFLFFLQYVFLIWDYVLGMGRRFLVLLAVRLLAVGRRRLPVSRRAGLLCGVFVL